VPSPCYKDGYKLDICLQFSSSSNVDGVTGMDPTPGVVTPYVLGLSDWFRDTLSHGVMEQFGILKNSRGRSPATTSASM
jgi:hypothetical protein